MRPTILYKGEEYPVSSASWNEYGELAHVSFEDENRNHHVAFRKLSFEVDGYNNGVLNLDLEKCVKWGDSVATR